MRTNHLPPFSLLLWGFVIGSCGPQEYDFPASSAEPTAQLRQHLVTEKWGFACDKTISAYAAVDRYSDVCIASIVAFDNRIVSPSGRSPAGSACVQVLDGGSSTELCQPLAWSTAYNTWLTSVYLEHRGYPCKVTALSVIEGYGAGCVSGDNRAVAFVSEYR